MAEDVKVIAFDSSKSPNSVPKTLHNVRFSMNLDRDIKVFDIGTFSFLMDDVFGGLKIPDYITDFNRSRKSWVMEFRLVEQLDGAELVNLESVARDLWYFFDVTCSKYRYNKLELGESITTDPTNATDGGTGPIYGRCKSFSFTSDMEDQGKVDCRVEFWMGVKIQLID